MIKSLNNKTPSIHSSVFVAETAAVVGDVSLEENSSVWYGATLRGDLDVIRVGKESNIQDGVVLHSDTGHPIVIGNRVSVGHQAVIHGCTIEDGSLIGMNAVLLNGCHIGKNCIIGAGALVPPGKNIPESSLVLGNPAEVVSKLYPVQVEQNMKNAEEYVRLARLHQESKTIG